MPDEPTTPAWSLDDVDDDALLARLKKLPGFADLFADPPPSAPPAPSKGEGDGVADKIAAAIEKLGKREPAPTPAATPEPIIQVVKQKMSWFWDE